MREIKIRVPEGQAESVAKLAIDAGISEVASHSVYVYGAGNQQEELKIKSSTPKIKKFLSHLFQAPFFNQDLYQFSAHDIRALVTKEGAEAVACPVYIPFSEIQQDLWQYSYVTASFVIRSAVSAGLLAYAFLKDDMVLAVGAMIFTPFSPLILTMAFGWASSRWRLMWQGAKAFLTALFLTVGAAALVAWALKRPILFNGFGGLGSNLLISVITGFMAAIADADDVGRRQLLGLAMAYPFVKFPTWVGICLGIGFPDPSTTHTRLLALGGNALVMMAAAASAYWLMGRRGELQHLSR